MVGFGFGGVHRLACGGRATTGWLAWRAWAHPPIWSRLRTIPKHLIERCVRTGVIRTPGYIRGTPDTWAKGSSRLLHPKHDAELLKGRPLLVPAPGRRPGHLRRTTRGPSPRRPPVLRTCVWCFGAGHWLAGRAPGVHRHLGRLVGAPALSDGISRRSLLARQGLVDGRAERRGRPAGVVRPGQIAHDDEVSGPGTGQRGIFSGVTPPVTKTGTG